MSQDNSNNLLDDIDKKINSITLNAKAPEFKPILRVNAPAFTPRFAPRPAATTQPTILKKPLIQLAQQPLSTPPVINLSSGNSQVNTTVTPSASNTTVPSIKPNNDVISTPSDTPKPVPALAQKPKAQEEPETVKKDISISQSEPETTLTAEEEQDLLEAHFKEHFNVIFIGHVDAGKSTLGGNILFLTGMVDKRTMEKYEREAKEIGRESWYLSWALDTNTEERAKGKTVECGRAYFETDKRRYTILDAPGHKNFVPSMLEGATQADVGVLVISARKGEFETGFDRGGQTREHAMLAKTNGVKHLIVAINKMDDSTVNWDSNRYDEIVGKITPFLRSSGYNPKTDLTFLPISAYSGANIKDSDNSKFKWYKGKTLLETLDNMDAVDRKINAPLRMPIMEKYKDMGTIVCGKIVSGYVKLGMKTIIMPNRRLCEIVTIFSENEQEIESSICGDNIKLRLRGVEEEDISEGHVLCDSGHPCHGTTTFDAQLVIVDAKNIIAAGYNSILHIHGAVEEVLISEFLHLMDKKGRKSRKPPHFVKKGQSCIARLTTNEPICIEKFSDFPQLGRFTLRDEGKTIAIGKVIKLH
ncbi:hypothetical protein BB561_003381 [Smittium simulii]|uniref:Eukaryotic peptide chain release factor GTP-binding subunit n=1 Tax=Smittium simulii TaxID=133385 RepID=A0A2T9YLM1_9FUNG|nr:hypothetical protein BB561_003381 [Smittium simulii]